MYRMEDVPFILIYDLCDVILYSRLLFLFIVNLYHYNISFTFKIYNVENLGLFIIMFIMIENLLGLFLPLGIMLVFCI